ncbi:MULTISPECIES: OsmC family protein [Dyella]|uniref:OsmC family peroxiredoxin n=2 Tax=Dyella TaxID=231454 RepID=A0A4R0YZL1_9GAMM|nr:MULTISPECIES: OsmC family protein [Dyella]TBR39911.1 OsmC family peroxiredoxin [Dyella terrae]TCI12508.1 OsmC family peroxiredoxin [Dyella soli]
MAHEQHHYAVEVTWTGNTGEGTRTYAGYSRDHEIRVSGRPMIPGSSDPAFRGNPERHNPEDMLVASLSTCHMLWYLHLASVAGVVVTAYLDEATGTMAVDDHGGRFTEVVLHPQVTIAAGSDPAKAEAAHEAAHHACFIANSVNFPVRCEPRIVVASL